MNILQCSDVVGPLEVLQCEFVIASQVLHFAEEIVRLVECVAAWIFLGVAGESFACGFEVLRIKLGGSFTQQAVFGVEAGRILLEQAVEALDGVCEFAGLQFRDAAPVKQAVFENRVLVQIEPAIALLDDVCKKCVLHLVARPECQHVTGCGVERTAVKEVLGDLHILGGIAFVLQGADKRDADVGVVITLGELTAIRAAHGDGGFGLLELQSVGEGRVGEEFGLFVLRVLGHQVEEHPEGFVATCGLRIITCTAHQQLVA